MRTHLEKLGVGPSSTNSWCHPGGAMCALGGAVIVHVLPLHANAGNSVRPPMLLPCVLDVAVRSRQCHFYARGEKGTHQR